jgi:ribonuclease R
LLSEASGHVQGHRDGHGFVIGEGAGAPDVYLSAQEMRSVLHRDRVRVRVVRYDRKGRPEGHVLEILERRKAPIIGRLLHEAGIWLLAPEDKRYQQDIIVPKNAIGGAQAGQVVAVELTEPPSMFSQPLGRVTEVLGEIDDPGMEIEIAVRKYEVPHRFMPETVAQAAALPDKLKAADRKHRVDLTDVALVTIDGEDARDFDDAVYCEPMPAAKGRAKKAAGWRLLVAIADVSHYVKPGEPLDQDAYERATSVYFPRRVIPMLPEKLSNGLCSLNPDVDRLCMVCDMVVSAEGEVEAYQFYPALMHSQARFTYNEVAAILANTKGPEAARRAALVPHLVHLHEVFRALLKRRAQRGAMEFESTETQIVCDDNGRIAKIVPRTRNDAHRLIEEAMLAANVCSADFIAGHKHPGLYRVHEGPTPEKRATLQSYLRALGLNVAVSEEPTPAEFRAIALATQDRPDALQIQTMLLRSMQQAIYTATNSGHFGLAYEAYTHFTSPIRRYPDLLVHRVIKALLHGKRYRIDSGVVEDPPAVRKGGKPPKPQAQEAERWEAAGVHCSANERRADEASRDVEAWLKCRYMRDRLGEEFDGTVTAATSFGLFVQLDELYVEGLLHISELGGEYWRFDEARQELRGERTGIRHGAGSRLRVQVSRVDLDARKIDFRLVREGAAERLLSRGRRDKPPLPASTAHPADAAPADAEEELNAVREQDRELRQAARGRGKTGKKKVGVGGRSTAGAKTARGAAASASRKSSRGGRAP